MAVSYAPVTDRVAFLPIGELRIDPRYQRSLSDPRVKRMAAAWDEDLADTITVSARSGGFFVIDGQHRMAAGRLAGVAGLWALVHTDLDSAAEARLFAELNSQRTKPSSRDLFRAQLVAGDEETHAILAEVQSIGWSVVLHGTGSAVPRRTNAVGALRKAMRYGVLTHTLRVLEQSWPDDPEAGRAEAILAVAGFINIYKQHPRYDQTRLIQKLSERSCLTLLQRMRGLRAITTGASGGSTVEKHGRTAVLEAYNRDLRGGRLPEFVSNGRNQPEWAAVPA